MTRVAVAPALRRAGWLAGLPALALVWVGATLYAGPGIAARVEAAGATVASATGSVDGEPWLRVTAAGRDLVATGEAPDVAERAAALAKLAALPEPRQVVTEVGTLETVSPFLWAAARVAPGRVALEGSRPAEIGRAALERQVTAALAPGTELADTARAARGAPPDFTAAAAFLAARLGDLAPGGRAALADTVLSLSGEALDVPAYDALRAALAEPPAGFSVGRVDVLPPRIAGYRLAVERDGRGLALEGYVPSEAARATALRAAAAGTDGGRVEDRLHTARGLPAGVDPDALMTFALKLADLIQSGRVAYADGSISVSGDAIDAQAVPEVRALMREGRPAGVAEGAVTLAVRPLSPYRVTLRRGGEGVALTGHLPDAETRARVLATLRPRLFREGVTDRTRIAEGAPPDLARALERAAPLLLTLAAGEVAVSDATVKLTGEGLYREAAERAPEALQAALPLGWAGEATVRPRQPAERRDAETCRAQFTAATAGADLRFPAGSSALAPGFYPVLDAVAALARACPTLRIAVSGPADPPKPRPAGEGAQPADAAAAAPGGQSAQTPASQASAGDAHPSPGAAKAPAKTSAKPPPKAAAGKAPPKPEAKADEPEGPPPDLPRQRALALVEYLLQAGARPDQVAPGPDAAPGRAALAVQP